jgi:hypothetical protein
MKLIALHRIERKGGPVLPGASFDEPSEKEANWLLAEGAAVASATPEPAAPTLKVEPLKVQKK